MTSVEKKRLDTNLGNSPHTRIEKGDRHFLDLQVARSALGLSTCTPRLASGLLGILACAKVRERRQGPGRAFDRGKKTKSMLPSDKADAKLLRERAKAGDAARETKSVSIAAELDAVFPRSVLGRLKTTSTSFSEYSASVPWYWPSGSASISRPDHGSPIETPPTDRPSHAESRSSGVSDAVGCVWTLRSARRGPTVCRTSSRHDQRTRKGCRPDAHPVQSPFTTFPFLTIEPRSP